MDSLTFTRVSARLNNIARRHPQTHDWLFGHEVFQQWNDEGLVADHHGILWIKGNPGTGKSVLMKTALEWTRKNRAAEVSASYFFNAQASDDLEKSSLGLYQSLAHVLLLSYPHTQGFFVQQFSTKSASEPWTAGELQGFLYHVIENMENRRLNLFIDALDEGNETDIRQMISYFEDLAYEATRIRAPLRILLSSRHFPHIVLRNHLSLTMETEVGHSNDVRAYIQNKLPSLQDADPNRFYEKLCRKSAGVFLWIVLIVPILRIVHDQGGGIEAMDARLEEMPKELGVLFAKIIAGSHEKMDESLLLFQWVLFAEEPLSLPELYHAVQVGVNGTRGDRISEQRMWLWCLNSSRGLVEVDTSSEEVRFIHETVQHFFKRHGLSQLCPDLIHNPEGLSHDRLRRCCFDNVEQMSTGLYTQQNRDMRRPPRDFPFSRYSTIHMFIHAEAAESYGVSQKEFLMLFHQPEFGNQHLLDWLILIHDHAEHERDYFGLGLNLFYVLANEGCSNLLKFLLQKNPTSNVLGQRHASALQTAAYHNHLEAVQLLIRTGSDVNAQGGCYGTVLQAAAATVYRVGGKLVQLLLDAGADVNARGGWYDTALQAAVAEGFASVVEVVQLLLDAGADVNAQGGRYGTALQAASHKGYTEVVQLLLAAGADVNVQGGEHGTALQAASRERNAKVIRLLLDAGANVDTQAGPYGTALRAALHLGYIEIVRLLLDAGADVNLQVGRYGTPLQAAVGAFGENVEVVRLLLDAGADVNAQGGEHGTALHAGVVARNGNGVAVVRLLLDAGADINAQARPCGTALRAAWYRNHVEMVRLLLDAGADIMA